MQSSNGLLDTLTEPQQLQVYELMAITDIQDGNIAARLFIDSNYDINVYHFSLSLPYILLS